jgi:heterodisulfide reductase subunit A-like polyferredoxin
LLWKNEGYFADSPAFVIDRKCTGCGLCVSVCSFKARYIDPVKNIAIVREDICKGCGICVASCRNGASQQYDFEKTEVMRELDQILV